MTIECPGKFEARPAARCYRPGIVRACLRAGMLLLLTVRAGICQDIEPRRWSHLPIGSNNLSAGYAVTTGDVFLDPVLRLENVEFELDTIAVRYIRSFELCGKSARVDIFGGYQSGNWSGLLDGVPASTERDGPPDMSVRLAVNLLGAPPLK